VTMDAHGNSLHAEVETQTAAELACLSQFAGLTAGKPFRISRGV
jgi:hypothetical protein